MFRRPAVSSGEPTAVWHPSHISLREIWGTHSFLVRMFFSSSWVGRRPRIHPDRSEAEWTCCLFSGSHAGLDRPSEIRGAARNTPSPDPFHAFRAFRAHFVNPAGRRRCLFPLPPEQGTVRFPPINVRTHWQVRRSTVCGVAFPFAVLSCWFSPPAS